jgi:hypothetical protein
LRAVAQFNQHRRVVGGLLPLAGVAVDAARRATRRERRRQQHVVDAQAVVLRKRELPVVPPRERLRRLLEQAKAVDQAGGEQRAERRALGFRHQHLPGPQRRVVHVTVVGCHIEVAEHRELRVADEFGAHHRRERLIPLELVSVLVRIDRLAVGHVHPDHAHAGDGRGDDTLLLVREVGNSEREIGRVESTPHQDGDAVVGLLPRIHRRIAGGRQFHRGKPGVLELGLLQADDVGAGGGKPVEQARQAHVEGVDVPGGENQGASIRLCTTSRIVHPDGLAHAPGARRAPRDGRTNRSYFG